MNEPVSGTRAREGVAERPLPGPWRHWPDLVLGLTLVVLYAPLVPWLHERFSRPDSFYSHGYLVPFIVFYLVYRVRDRIHWDPAAGSLLGLLLLVPGLALLALGKRVMFPEAAAASLPIVVIGTLVVRIGSNARPLWWPALYLGFMIPLPVFLLARAAQAMKLWVVDAALACLGGLGMPVARSGVEIVLQGGPSLLVGDECSGLRSLIAMLALGCLYASLKTSLSGAGRGALVLASIPVALVSNIVRIMLLTAIAFGSGQPVPALVHDGSGLLVFAVAFALFLLVEKAAVRPWAEAHA
ncbi:MAG: exosortase/archaeosortase family protein [Planctomycetota bacterium]